MHCPACLPLIVIGSMNLTRTVESGLFYCPECRSLQSYRLRSRRPYLTIYLLPMIPLGPHERFVQCHHCGTHWDVAILETSADKFRHAPSASHALQPALWNEEALRAAVLVAIDKGEISEQEIIGLQRLGTRIAQRPVDREDLGELCSSAYQNKISAKHFVQSVAHRWSAEQRREAMQACFLAASIKGELQAAELQLLREIQQVLGISDEEFQAAVEEAIEAEE